MMRGFSRAWCRFRAWLTPELVWHAPPELSPRAGEIILRLMGLDAGNIPRRLRVLDFGCGKGRYLRLFASLLPEAELFGCDVEVQGVEQVRRDGFVAAVLDPEVAKLPYDDASFDFVYSSNVVEHIPRPLYEQYLREVRRVLKPGGRFVVGTPNYPIKRLYDMFTMIGNPAWRYYLFDDPTHVNKLSCRRLERDLAEVFDKVHLEATQLFMQRRVRVLRRVSIRRRLRYFGNKLVGYATVDTEFGLRPPRV